jgi:hypothetical protein
MNTINQASNKHHGNAKTRSHVYLSHHRWS